MNAKFEAVALAICLAVTATVAGPGDAWSQGVGASVAKAAAERAAGGRAVGVSRRGNVFIVTVKSKNAVRRCRVDANSGRVLGC